MGLMINCKEATLLIEKKQEAPFGVGEKVKLAFHLAVCKVCAIYEKQSKLMDAVLKKKTETEPDLETIQKLKEKIKASIPIE